MKRDVPVRLRLDDGFWRHGFPGGVRDAEVTVMPAEGAAGVEHQVGGRPPDQRGIGVLREDRRVTRRRLSPDDHPGPRQVGQRRGDARRGDRGQGGRERGRRRGRGQVRDQLHRLGPVQHHPVQGQGRFEVVLAPVRPQLGERREP